MRVQYSGVQDRVPAKGHTGQVGKTAECRKGTVIKVTQEFIQYEKTGYLKEPFKVFHLRDHAELLFDFHYHDFYKIIYFVDGMADYKVEGKTYHLRPHDFVLVGANVIHKPEIDKTVPYERYIIYLSEEFVSGSNERGESLKYCFEEAEKSQNRVVHFAAESYEEIVGCLLHMEKIAKQEGAYMNELLLQSAFMEFMILFNRNVIAQPRSYIATAAYHEKVIDVIAYIQEHLTEEINVDVLAGQCYVSKYYLMRQFKEATGYSIHQYINEKRVQAARRMILSGMPASQACYECGFHDYSTFARRFKMIVGTAPSKLGSGNV